MLAGAVGAEGGGASSDKQKFSKVLSVSLYGITYAWALIFDNVCQCVGAEVQGARGHGALVCAGGR